MIKASPIDESPKKKACVAQVVQPEMRDNASFEETQPLVVDDIYESVEPTPEYSDEFNTPPEHGSDYIGYRGVGN